MEEKIYVGIIGVLTLLAGLGGSTYLTQEEFDNTYVCEDNQKFGVYHRLSSTSKTAYYYDELGNERYNRCSTLWVSLADYLNKEGLTMEQFIAQSNNILFDNVVREEFVCDREGCMTR